jgi:hypothetical protein
MHLFPEGQASIEAELRNIGFACSDPSRDPRPMGFLAAQRGPIKSRQLWLVLNSSIPRPRNALGRDVRPWGPPGRFSSLTQDCLKRVG